MLDAVVDAKASQSPVPPDPLVIVTVTGAPVTALVVLTVSVGGMTTTVGLVARRSFVAESNRNSYDPGAAGMVTVQVRVLTPEPTTEYCKYEEFGAVTEASESQSRDPPRPLVSVAVTDVRPATLVALTVKTGAGRIVKFKAEETPPPGSGVNTVTCAVPAVAMSFAPIDA